MASPKPINSAARNALALVVRSEQVRTIARLSLVRVSVALACLVAMLILPAPGIDTRPSIIGAALSLIAGTILLLVARRTKAIWPAYATAVLDVPLVVAIQWWQARLMPDLMLIVPPNIAMMMGLVALSTLSMS